MEHITLTGGPGGGRSTLIEELAQDLGWRDASWPCRRPSLAGRVGISPSERLFQKLVVEIQRGMEDALACALDPSGPRLLLPPGTLDPLAYWLDSG